MNKEFFYKALAAAKRSDEERAKRLKAKGYRLSPVIVPKDRTMKKEIYRVLDSSMRQSFNQNKDLIDQATSDSMLYGSVYAMDKFKTSLENRYS